MYVYNTPRGKGTSSYVRNVTELIVLYYFVVVCFWLNLYVLHGKVFL